MARARRCVAAVALSAAVAGCVVDDDSSTDREPVEVEFATAEQGDTWESIAERLLGCDDPIALAGAIEHLARSNPLIADAGLTADASVAFDPVRLGRLGCGDPPPTDDDPELAQPTADGDTEPAEPTVEGDTELAEPTVDGDSPRDGGDVASGTDPAGSRGSADDMAAETNSGASGPTDLSSPDVDDVPATPGPELVDGSPSLVAFAEDFAEESGLERFRWQIHHAVPFHGTPQTWQGDHDLDCNPPGTYRTINVPEEGPDPGEAAYWCAPGGPETAHLMTSFRTDGYAQVAFSPNRVFEHVRRICWDQNMTDLGGRKWTQLIVVPDETFSANDERLDYVRPSTEAGPGAAGVFLSEEVFLLVLQSGATVTHLGRDLVDEDYRAFTTLDKKRRYTTCVEDLENGTVRIELEREESVEVREQIGAFPDGPARVIFQDDTYNSTKAPSPVEEPFTWHWDDIVVQTLDIT